MGYEHIRYSAEDGIATITLNRPGVMNGLSSKMRGELIRAFDRAAEEARAIILTGVGRAFCSGQNLRDGARRGRRSTSTARCARSMSR